MENPKIRFKGFTKDWEQRKLGDEAEEILAGGDIDKEKAVDDGVYPIYANALTNDGIVGYYDDYYRVKAPAVTVTGRGEVGRAQARMIDFTPVVRLLAVRSNHDCYFLENAINNHKVVVESTGVPQLTVPQLSSYDICFPKDIVEEKKIGTYFNQLDRLITLHQRKCEQTKKLKKYMLQKMFPQNGAKVPEIRFDGFTYDWEQRKLLDCIQKITDFRGRTPKKLGMDWSEEGYLALSALNVKNGYINFNQDVHYGNQELYDKWMTGNELHKGQVLFTTEAPMGNVAQVPDNRRYILSQRTIAFDVKDKLITENFLATVLRTPTVFAELTALSSGGTAKGVSQKSLASVEIRLPKDLNEQEKIADTFFNLDHLITLHQHKCDELKKMKKYMLQNMFI